MKDLIPPEVDILVVLSGLLVRIGVIDVKDLSLVIPVDLYVLREQRLQT